MDSPLCKPFQPSPLPPDVSPFPSGPSSATLFPSVSDNNRHLALLAALWMDLWQRLAVVRKTLSLSSSHYSWVLTALCRRDGWASFPLLRRPFPPRIPSAHELINEMGFHAICTSYACRITPILDFILLVNYSRLWIIRAVRSFADFLMGCCFDDFRFAFYRMRLYCDSGFAA
ncbi:hypothetical protein TNCV_3896701 [Trichonephila clavipes]|nr:hypothetical protein TNCV_3896701 [Trichonephila clavipes]